MEVDSGQRVIVAYGEGDFTDKAQFILANNYPDQNLSEEGLHWQWQTDLILGDDAALLQLFENDIKRDELRYGSDFGKLAENDSTQDSVYVLKREGYEKGQNTSDYPEYAKQAKDWEQQGDIALIKGDYVLRELHLKRYELKDHLGNVRVIVADVKDATLGLQGQPREFAAILKHYSNYYPFGMEKPAMVYDKGGYRYGFNGKENDDEVKGVANSVDFGARIYDSRAARFLTVDPYAPKVAFESHFMFAGNNPIKFIDFNGGFKIDPTLQKKYPNFCTFLKITQFHGVKKDISARNFYEMSSTLSAAYFEQNLTYNNKDIKQYEPTIYAMNDNEKKAGFNPVYQQENGEYGIRMGSTLESDGDWDIKTGKRSDIALSGGLISLYEQASIKYSKSLSTSNINYSAWALKVALEYMFEVTIIHEMYHSASQNAACATPGAPNDCAEQGQFGWYGGDESQIGYEVGHQAEDIIYGQNKVFNYNAVRLFLSKNNVFSFESSKNPDVDGNGELIEHKEGEKIDKLFHLTPMEGGVNSNIKRLYQKYGGSNNSANKDRSDFQKE